MAMKEYSSFPKSTRWASSSGLVSYPQHKLWGGYIISAEMQYANSTVPADRDEFYKKCLYIVYNRTLAKRLECSPIVRETWVRSQVESYQRLKKWYLMPPCITLSIIRYGSRVKWSNPGKGVAPSPTPWCSKLSEREPSGHPRLWSPTLLYLYIVTTKILDYVLWGWGLKLFQHPLYMPKSWERIERQ